MKILALSARIPAVERNGDQVISYFRITHLARTHQVELICFGNRAIAQDLTAIAKLEAAGIVVHLVAWKRWVAAWQVLRALPDPSMPLQSAYFRSAHLARTFDAVRARFAPDALYVVMIRIMPNIAHYSGPLFVEMVDSMGLNFGRRAGMERGLKGGVLALEAKRVARYEQAIAERADRSFVVSRIDQQSLGSDRVSVLPLGVDVERFCKGAQPALAPIVAFTGNMFYQPNADAVLWFAQHCWPAIKAAVPGVRLRIAGNRPQERVVALGNHDLGIEVMGRVDSVAAVLQGAAVAVAPMRSGSGMQFKILEAMACGVPVVATSLGQGDIGCTAGADLLVADTPQAFAEQVIALLKSPQLRSQVGDAGWRYLQSNHSWDAINQQFAQACRLA